MFLQEQVGILRYHVAMAIPDGHQTDIREVHRVRTKLESPWMSLNLETKIQGLECPWICKEVLECPWILLALVFGYFLKLFDIQDGHFVELILHVHIWPHYEVTFWTIQRQILLISNAFSSVFSPWICWYMTLNVLEKSLNLTLPDMYEPWVQSLTTATINQSDAFNLPD
jgi:hypothetical protein